MKDLSIIIELHWELGIDIDVIYLMLQYIKYTSMPPLCRPSIPSAYDVSESSQTPANQVPTTDADNWAEGQEKNHKKNDTHRKNRDTTRGVRVGAQYGVHNALGSGAPTYDYSLEFRVPSSLPALSAET